MKRSSGFPGLIIAILLSVGMFAAANGYDHLQEPEAFTAPAVAQKENQVNQDLRLPEIFTIESVYESRAIDFSKTLSGVGVGNKHSFLLSAINSAYSCSNSSPCPIYLIFLNLRI